MRVLVVGGAGYIGSHAVLDLLQNNHLVTVFDDLSTGREENLFDDAHFVEGNMLSPTDLDRLLAVSQFDAVMHFAALKAVGDSMKDPGLYSEHNIFGSMNLINKAVKHGISKFIFSSTAAVFGEPEYLPIDEQHRVVPTNFYGYTKLQIERHLEWYCRLKGLRYAALRYFNAAGYDSDGRIPGLEINPQNLIPVIMEVASGIREELQVFGNDYETRDGTCIRDYIHVTDLAEAHTRALEYLDGEDRSLIVNLGTESGHTVNEVIAASELVIGKKLPVRYVERRPGDAPSLVASPGKARELLDWQARHNLSDMLSSTWKLYNPN